MMLLDFIKVDAYNLFCDVALSIAFITMLYFLIGIVFKYFGGRTISQYSSLDLISLLIFAGLTENAIIMAVDFTSSFSLLISAIYIIMFNYFISNTRLYKKMFPINRILLIKNGKIIDSGLRKATLSIDYLWIELRKSGVINIIQVKEAYMEPNSSISILQINDSHIDPVTGLSFHWSSSKDWVSKLFKSGSESVSVIAIDFKNTGDMNDKYGKTTVNKALKEAADILSDTIRYDDKSFRFNFDRFLIVANSGKDHIDRVVQNIEMKLSIMETIKGYSFDVYVDNIDNEDDFDESVNNLTESINKHKGEGEGDNSFIKIKYMYENDFETKHSDEKKLDYVKL